MEEEKNEVVLKNFIQKIIEEDIINTHRIVRSETNETGTKLYLNP